METKENVPHTEEAPKVAKPFASRAQHAKWVELLEQGKVTQESFDAKMGVTDFSSLPERVSRT